MPAGNYPIAQVNYELNVLGTRGPRRMQCTMHSIPTTAVDPEGVVPGQPKELLPRLFEESFRTSASSFSKYSSVADHSSMDFGSSRFSECGLLQDGGDAGDKEAPLVLRNKSPRWHEQLQCWCLNFRGRVTVASVKNFQLIAAPPPPPAAATEAPGLPSQQAANNSSSQRVQRLRRRRQATTRCCCSSGRCPRTRSRWTTGTRCRHSRHLPSA